MNETILVIFVFMVLLGIGLVGFYKYNQYSVDKIYQEDTLSYFYSSIGTFANMPEIKCSYLNSNQDCIDAFKLLAFKNKGFFGFSKITITKVYPEYSDKECTINLIKEKKDCGVFTIYDKEKPDSSGKDVIYSPISLYYPNEDKYYIAQLKIEVFR